MKKLFLTAMTAVFAATVAKAQLPYTVTTQTNQAYTPLTGGTSINGTTIWDEEQFGVPFPPGFNFRINGISTTSFNLDLSVGLFASATTGTVNGFLYDFFTDLTDRGTLDSSVSKSPIRYAIEGTAPNRIFKAEIANAGFYNEIDQYGTANDSVNIQIWLYETSSVVELRYGPNSVVNFTDYYFAGGPIIGYLKNGDLNSQTFETIYNFAGNPSAPTIDSIDMNFNVVPLDDYPANGTVYRFVPKPLGFANGAFAGTMLNVFPTAARERLTVTYSEDAAAYRVVTLSGAIVTGGQLRKGTNHLNVANLAPGNYVLEVQTAGGKAALRFSKQ